MTFIHGNMQHDATFCANFSSLFYFCMFVCQCQRVIKRFSKKCTGILQSLQQMATLSHVTKPSKKDKDSQVKMPVHFFKFSLQILLKYNNVLTAKYAQIIRQYHLKSRCAFGLFDQNQRVDTNYLDWPKMSLLVKNLQFLFYPNETWSK